MPWTWKIDLAMSKPIVVTVSIGLLRADFAKSRQKGERQVRYKPNSTTKASAPTTKTAPRSNSSIVRWPGVMILAQPAYL